jgi:hypothetical protein
MTPHIVDNIIIGKKIAVSACKDHWQQIAASIKIIRKKNNFVDNIIIGKILPRQ